MLFIATFLLANEDLTLPLDALSIVSNMQTEHSDVQAAEGLDEGRARAVIRLFAQVTRVAFRGVSWTSVQIVPNDASGV